MKIVLDCNIIISAGLSHGKCREVLKTVLTNHNNYISDEIVREFRDVIYRKKFATYKANLIGILESVCVASSWLRKIPISNQFKLPDAGDQKYLDLALSIPVDYIITGNIKDFPLKNYHSLRVISPGEFLELTSIND